MADPLTDPVVLAAVAIMAAKDGRPDALARGDVAAQAMAQAQAMTITAFQEYKGLPGAERLQGWRDEKWVGGLDKPTAVTMAALGDLYATLYPQQGGIVANFLEIPWSVHKAAAILAAQSQDPSALQKGDNAAQAMVWAGQWTPATYTEYTLLTADERVAFWSAGGDAAQLAQFGKNGDKSGGKPPPPPASGGNTALYVVGGIAGLYLLSRLFAKGR